MIETTLNFFFFGASSMIYETPPTHTFLLKNTLSLYPLPRLEGHFYYQLTGTPFLGNEALQSGNHLIAI